MSTIAGALIDGHILLSDWLLLAAAIIFVVAAVIVAARTPKAWADRDVLVAAGLAAVAVGLLVV